MISTTAVEVRRRHVAPDVASVLSVFAVTLICLPSRLIFGSLGAVGTPATVIGCLCALWWTSSRFAPHLGGAVGRQPVRVALLLFGAALLTSYTAGMLRPLLPDEISGSDRLMIAVIGWLGVALLCADGIKDRVRLESLLRHAVWLDGLLAVGGIVEFCFPVQIATYVHVPGLYSSAPLDGPAVRDGLIRVQATAIHPIEFGMVLSMMLPLAIWQALASGRRWNWLTVLAIAVALPMTLSRSAVLGAATGLLVLLAGWPAKRRWAVLTCVTVFLVVMGSAVPKLFSAIEGLFTHVSSDPSTTARTEDYGAVWGMIVHRPLFGRGTGTFVPSEYRILDNQYLLTLIESGLAGVGCLLGVLVTAMTCARGARQRSLAPWTRELGQALAASVAVAMVGFITLDAFSFPMSTGLFFLIVGCCGVLWRLEALADEIPCEVEDQATF